MRSPFCDETSREDFQLIAAGNCCSRRFAGSVDRRSKSGYVTVSDGRRELTRLALSNHGQRLSSCRQNGRRQQQQQQQPRSCRRLTLDASSQRRRTTPRSCQLLRRRKRCGSVGVDDKTRVYPVARRCADCLSRASA
jgi:hypothetical protein